MLSKRKREPLRLRQWGGGLAAATAAARAIQGAWRNSRPKKKARLSRLPSAISTATTASSIRTLLAGKTRTGREIQEGANSLTRCDFGTHKATVPKEVLNTLQLQAKVLNAATTSAATTGLQEGYNFSLAEPATLLAMITGQTDQMILHKVAAEVLLVNSSSSNSCMTIYDIVCRKDCSTASNSNALNAWQTGVDAAATGSNNYRTVGSIPFESVTFNQFYKVVQTTRISLAPGEMHRHEVVYKPNKTLYGEYLNNVNYGLAGVTLHSLFVHHGMPAHDSTTTTNCTVDPSNLDIVIKESYDFRMLDNSVTHWTRSNNLATSFAVGEQFVNEAVGQLQDASGLHPGTLHA